MTQPALHMTSTMQLENLSHVQWGHTHHACYAHLVLHSRKEVSRLFVPAEPKGRYLPAKAAHEISCLFVPAKHKDRGLPAKASHGIDATGTNPHLHRVCATIASPVIDHVADAAPNLAAARWAAQLVNHSSVFRRKNQHTYVTRKSSAETDAHGTCMYCSLDLGQDSAPLFLP